MFSSSFSVRSLSLASCLVLGLFAANHTYAQEGVPGIPKIILDPLSGQEASSTDPVQAELEVRSATPQIQGTQSAQDAQESDAASNEALNAQDLGVPDNLGQEAAKASEEFSASGAQVIGTVEPVASPQAAADAQQANINIIELSNQAAGGSDNQEPKQTSDLNQGAGSSSAFPPQPNPQELQPPVSGSTANASGAGNALVPQNQQATNTGQNTVGTTPQDQKVDDVFFDSNSLAPSSQMATRGTIRKVNPVTQPASRFVIVDTDAKANTYEAKLVAASRASKVGRHDSALEIYNSLYKKNKRDPRVLMGRAIALQNMGLFDEAMRVYEEFSKVDKKNVEAKVNMLGLLSTRFPAVALQRLKDLRTKNPDHMGVLAQLAITEGRLGNYESAMKYFGVAASLEPKNASHAYNMGVISDKAGDKKTAVKLYEKSLELDSVYGLGQSIPRELIYERLAVIR